MFVASNRALCVWIDAICVVYISVITFTFIAIGNSESLRCRTCRVRIPAPTFLFVDIDFRRIHRERRTCHYSVAGTRRDCAMGRATIDGPREPDDFGRKGVGVHERPAGRRSRNRTG